MNNYPLIATLGLGSLFAFFLFFVFYKLLRWGGKMAALATAACMLIIYIPLVVTHWDGIDVFAIHFAFFMMIPYGLGIITGVHEERRELEGDEIERGMHWIPALIIVFFLLLAAWEGFFISSATGGLGTRLAKILLPEPASEDIDRNISSNFTGAVSNNYQDEEKQFDKNVTKLNKQRERGWKIKISWSHTAVVNKISNLIISPVDKAGVAISGADVTVEFRRSSDMSYDKLYKLHETTDGQYSVPVKLTLAGCWTTKILVKKGNDEHETKAQPVISTMIDGKLFTPECIEGEPDVDDKLSR